jgi:enoyl-CoA hydratase
LNDDDLAGRRFFFAEYRLNHLIKTWPKPVVAFMDGITMGGGVGLTGPSRIRIATERTRFAMPETGIGLFPDVGGGWYLSRLRGRLGQYLALTGARLDGSECLWAGLATHHLPSEILPAIKQAIARSPNDLAAILDGHGAASPPPALAQKVAEIDRLFSSDRLEDILDALAADHGPFARETLAVIASRSLLSCKVSLRELAESLSFDDFAAEMAMEYRIASRILVLPDFAEGVRALIVDKDNAPRWNWRTAQEVDENLLDAIFAPLPEEDEWHPL